MYNNKAKRPGSFLSESLQPQNWAKLADRRTPWPEDLDPKQALKELAQFMEYRMIEDSLRSQGRSIDTLIQRNEGRY